MLFTMFVRKQLTKIKQKEKQRIILCGVWEKILLQVIQRIKKWGINLLQYINYLYSDIGLCYVFNSDFCYGGNSVNT